jgi:hypothetical protein
MEVLNKGQQDKHAGYLSLPSLALDTRISAGMTICAFSGYFLRNTAMNKSELCDLKVA